MKSRQKTLNAPRYEKPTATVMSFKKSSTTVLGNCSFWKGGGFCGPCHGHPVKK